MKQGFTIYDVLGSLSVIVLGILAFYIIIRNYRSKYYFNFWSPLTFISLFYLYYVVITPLNLFLTGNAILVGVDMANSAYLSWFAALLSFASILMGFRYYRGFKNVFWKFRISHDQAFKYGFILFLLGFILWTSVRGFQFNIFEVDETRSFITGGFTMYITSAISFLVASSGLILFKILKKKNVYYFIPLILTLMVFIIQGSRFRLVYLVITMATIYYIHQKKKLNIILWAIIGFGFFLLMGIIEISRNYSRGLDLTKVEGMQIRDFVDNAQNESKVFFFSGEVIKYVLKTGEHIYFEPITTALFMPLPRAIFPTKPDGQYLRYIQNRILGSDLTGAAFLHYAEFFYAFGWIGVIINGLLIGMMSKAFWVNFLRQPENLTSILTLGLFNGFLYILISRGYLAQAFFSFMYFIVIPILIVRILLRAIR